jgi:hypothetical protein
MTDSIISDSLRKRPACRALGFLFQSFLLATAALLTPIALWAETAVIAPIQAGWIDSFDGPANDYAVVRGSETLAARFLMPLLTGDRILVRRADGLIRIRLGETQTLVLNQAKSPYDVPSVDAPPSVAGNLMRWASAWFTELHSEPSPARLINTIGRGDPATGPASGLFFSDTVGLAAGQRPLTLAWRGGTPHFELRLVRGDETAPLVEQSGIADRTYRTPRVDLRPGRHRLEIQDSLGQKIITDLSVIDTDQVPHPGPDAIPADLPDEVRRTVAAAWLASQQGGWVWRLEAYQRIADEGTYPPAVLLRSALLEDRELPAPPPASD